MIHEITSEEEFYQSIQDNETVIYDFSAEWCGPCRFIEPIVMKLSEEHTNVKVYKLDVDKLSNVAESEGIRAMPTFKLYKNGNLVNEVVGPSKKAIEDLFLN
ncbi:thioredoxin-like protein [Conidiobolus coronatus NRRL 28638]|uniref:Thioredoxin n=1 Tax=Conidiobolus coronatus (strain ATCC 28846 / CBS 209.66 / NRRL 28638) TaxID=796925 RepID=A0A137NV03_CONC2|nr:thioredoxin-like protein [Conidiobolus coronatus NRRL 28638]|eukprot:KXN66586.1 thioredoxin-like protein [Conidiobolus coronatus NRRL 28638]